MPHLLGRAKPLRLPKKTTLEIPWTHALPPEYATTEKDISRSVLDGHAWAMSQIKNVIGQVQRLRDDMCLCYRKRGRGDFRAPERTAVTGRSGEVGVPGRMPHGTRWIPLPIDRSFVPGIRAGFLEKYCDRCSVGIF